MIKLKNIVNEQGGSFRDLVDGYLVMKDPVEYGGISNYNPEVGGFTFSSDDKVATKQYKGSELKLVWRGAGKFNVFYYNKDQGVFTFDGFGDWLTKLAQNITQMLPVAELTSLGFKKAKDPETGYSSYVKIIKTYHNDTATTENPKGLWSCDTAIRVFAKSPGNWMIRAKIGRFEKPGLDALIDKDASTYSTNYGGFPVGRTVKKKSWLTGREYKEFEQITPEEARGKWQKNTGQAIHRVQYVNVTADKLINTVKFMESKIREYKGLVGPYNDPKFQNNYLFNLIKNINK